MPKSLRSVMCVCLYVCLAGLLSVSMAGFVPTAAWGQAISTGTVAGTVVDNTNAVVPGATITITQRSTGTVRTTTTNNVGYYIFQNVQPGTYDVRVTMQGFTTASFNNQTVNVGTALTLNAKLQVGATTTTVEVTSTPGAELQTLNSTVGTTITSTALQSLPAIGREANTFFTLQPGVSPDGSVGGTVVDNSSFTLDGGQNTNDMDGSMNVYTPSFSNDPSNLNYVGGGPTGVMPTPVDSVEEVKVNTSNQTADFNSSSGAQVEEVTKRGTNSIHGTVYEYYLDNNWNANTWQNNANGRLPNGKEVSPLPSYHFSRFGANLGGPIIPKKILGGKTYMFGFFQGFRWPNSATIEKPVPSPGMEQGLLQFDVCDAACQASATPTPVTTVFNLNPTTTTYTGPDVGALRNGTPYPSSTACGGLGGGVQCNPSATLGISPTMQTMWTKFMPAGNEIPGTPTACTLGRCTADPWNVWGFTANMALPQHDNQVVARIDHDFGAKWHFTGTYRYYRFIRQTASQVDIGGFFPGDKLGVPTSTSTRPQIPWLYTAGLTTDISPTTTNDFHYSFLRNWWAWGSADAPVQIAGLGAALEPLGETASPLAPYNVNTQSVRTRFWDGHDNTIRDDVTTLRGNHLLQFGGTYEHNFNFHQRSDNGGGINFAPVYRLGESSSSGINMAGFIPVDPTTGNPDLKQSTSTWAQDYSMVLGIPGITQIAYTRSGPNLALNPPLTHAFDQINIPFYNVYFSDTWHMKPTFTLNYGLGWTLEMPPTEVNGKIISLVDQAGQLLDTEAYLHQRKAAALQGQVYNPAIGFALIGNSGRGLQRAYNTFYGSFSPRVSVAWNPKFSGGFLQRMFGENATVIRGGYGRIYGRLNGVDLVLVPLLGTGLIQAVQCFNPLNNTNGNVCAGSATATPNNAYRIGPTLAGFDGLTPPIPVASPTLPQPDYPGINAIAAGAGETLDPNFRPNVVDSFDFSIQRQLAPKVTMEVGYIGRRITHEFQPINLNAVPYMMTLGGQSFANAYAQTVQQYCGGVSGLGGGGCAGTASAVTPQPFFEAALGGTSSAYCSGFTSCTAAVVAREGISKTGTGNLANAQVWSLWSDLDNSCNGANTCNGGKGGFVFNRTMMNTPIPGSSFGASGQLTSGVAQNLSVGYGNYNAVFATLRTSDWHGLTMGSNFTFSKTLGTGAFVQASSEYAPDDAFNLHAMYGLQAFDVPFVFNQYVVYQEPFYKGQKGLIGRLLGGWTIAPLFAAGNGFPVEAFPSTGDPAQAFGASDGANFFDNENPRQITAYTGGHSAIVSKTRAKSVNMFANPSAVLASWRNPILGLDGNASGVGFLRGLPYWNMDMAITKNIRVTERFNAEFQTNFVNVLNHNQFGQPNLDMSAGSGFGRISGEASTPRQIQFGLRVSF